MLRVLVADDHALYRRGLVMELEDGDGLDVIAEATSGEEAVELGAALAPDVIVMDVRMPGIGGIEATRRLVDAMPSVRVLMLTVSDDADDLLEAVKAGAVGYLLKESAVETIGSSVRGVALGHSFVPPELAGRLLDEFARLAQIDPVAGATDRDRAGLSEREVAILRVMADGADDRALADAIGSTEHGVRNHVRNILGKLQLASRAEAVLYASRRGMIDP
ncbi:MAG: response regulator transcription factor [Acidimicrobiales bacterium]